MPERTGRSWTIDFLKTIAIFGVLVIHVSAGRLGGGICADWLGGLFWAAASRASVPLFLLCSGALLLDPGHDLPLKKLWGRNFLRLLAALLFWAAAYRLLALRQTGFSPAGLIQAGKDLLLFHHQNHLYYLHIMLLVYAFLPVTRMLTRHGTKPQLQYALALWFVLGILYPTVHTFWPFTLLEGIPVQWRMNMAYAAIGYGLLGWYLQKWPLRRRTAGVLAAVGFASIFLGTAVFSARNGALYQGFLEGMSVGVCLLAAGLFGLGMSLPAPPERVRAFFAWWSKASFCIFLVHIFFLDLFRSRGWTLPGVPALAAIPLVSLALALCGGTVYALLSRIPVVRRWLI